MTTFEMSPSRFIEQYFEGKKQFVNRNMAYGSLLAEGLENEEATGDPFLDLMMARIPKFDRMDMHVEDKKGINVEQTHHGKTKVISIPLLKNNGDDIPILALPDTAKEDYTAFKEYKTSVRKWTQKMADESGQITFYATAIWLAKGFVPKDIELIDVQVAYDADGRLQPTGDIYRFLTKRSMVDVIKMTTRIKKAWAGIAKLGEKTIF
jgi:hypothetical protein